MMEVYVWFLPADLFSLTELSRSFGFVEGLSSNIDMSSLDMSLTSSDPKDCEGGLALVNVLCVLDALMKVLLFVGVEVS